VHSSALDASILSSYKLGLPAVFAGKLTETLNVSMKQLPGLHSFRAWDTHSALSGMRSTMREKVRHMKSSYMAKITNSKISGEAKLVAQTMLTTSVAFVEAVSAFLSNFYAELINDENRTGPTEAWILVCSIVRRVFDDIAVHRGRASFVDYRNNEKGHIATQYVWASLQAQRIMAEYTTHEFRHHPSIAPIINYHLYTHRVPWTHFIKLKKEVADVKATADLAKRTADKSNGPSGRGNARAGRGSGSYDE
jgi:hypothetical protein